MAVYVDELRQTMNELTKSHLEKVNVEVDDKSSEDVTLCGVHHWYQHVFEKFGWMILLTNKLKRIPSNTFYFNFVKDKLELYTREVHVLIASLKHRATTSNDVDKENVIGDLNLMAQNLEILLSAHNIVQTGKNEILLPEQQILNNQKNNNINLEELLGGAKRHSKKKSKKSLKKGSKKD